MANILHNTMLALSESAQPVVYDDDIVVAVYFENDYGHYEFTAYYNNELTVDWGDGTVDTYTTSHTYDHAGAYIIKINGAYQVKFDYDASCDGHITDFLWMNPQNITNVDYMFTNCQSLTNIANGVKFPSLSSYEEVFNFCSRLTSYPDSLFENIIDDAVSMSSTSSFISTFSNTHLTDVGNILDESVMYNFSHSSTFSNCQYLTELRNSSRMPQNCPHLFFDCENLSDFRYAFSNVYDPGDWSYAWYHTAITWCYLDNVLSYGNSNWNLSSTFSNCPYLENFRIGLGHSPYINNMDNMLAGCISLLQVQGDSFIHPNGSNPSCQYTLANCINLSDLGHSPFYNIISQGEWDNYPHDYFFLNCSSLPNYSSIPSDWK